MARRSCSVGGAIVVTEGARQHAAPVLQMLRDQPARRPAPPSSPTRSWSYEDTEAFFAWPDLGLAIGSPHGGGF